MYQLKKNLQNHKFFIYTDHDLITSDLIFIKKFVSQINRLDVNDDVNSNDMEKIKHKLSNSNIKVIFVA